MGGLNLTPVVKNLLFINIAVFIIQLMQGPFMDKYMSLHVIQSSYFQPYQLFTHMFMHSTHNMNGSINISHILFNMFGLVMFGSVLETFWGPKKFLLYYIICGLGAAIIQSGVYYYEIHQMQQNIDPGFMGEFYESLNNFSMVGASGAIFGLLLAFGMLFPNTELMMLFFPIPIKAKYFVIIYGALELFLGLGKFKGDNIAHFAHLGGMIFGFILIKYWQKQRKSFY
jgi:membrane associated rhomboid family serine protease